MNKQTPEDRMKEIIFDNLDREKFKVFLFWSRVMWNYRKNSDYDIWILGEKRLSFQELMRPERSALGVKVKNKLRELPYLVDLVDFNAVDDDFKEIALNKIIKWN